MGSLCTQKIDLEVLIHTPFSVWTRPNPLPGIGEKGPMMGSEHGKAPPSLSVHHMPGMAVLVGLHLSRWLLGPGVTGYHIECTGYSLGSGGHRLRIPAAALEQ